MTLSAQRRLLLISYHFPPHTAIGGRRWEQLAALIAEHGWGLDVIAAHDPAISMNDHPRLRALPDSVRVYGAGELETLSVERAENWLATHVRKVRNTIRRGPGQEDGSSHTRDAPSPAAKPADDGWRSTDGLRWQLTGARGWLRLYWTWLERTRYARWNAHAQTVALRVANPATHLAVIVSGPPNPTYAVGQHVSAMTGIPFVMDMRDPWAQADRVPEPLATPYALRAMHRAEQAAVAQASLIVANTDVARETLAAAYPHRASDILVVMNGADEAPVPASCRAERFRLAHAGSIYRERDIRHLFLAVRAFTESRGVTPEQFGVDFIGYPEGRGAFSLRALAAETGVTPFVTVGPSLPHADALEFMAESAMLLVMSGLDMAIPAKLFEYVRFNAWLLAMAAPTSALARALDGAGADVVGPTDVAAITQALEMRYDQHRRGATPPLLNADGRFGRRAQAERLVQAIERIQRSVV